MGFSDKKAHRVVQNGAGLPSGVTIWAGRDKVFRMRVREFFGLWVRGVGLVALAGMMGVLAGCAGRGVGRVSLEPVPFAMVVPEGIARRLTTGPVEGLFGREVGRAGVLPLLR